MGNSDETRAAVARGGLLGAGDAAPFEMLNASARGPFLLLGDHAGRRIPAALGTLGIGEADRARHIAWDIGTAALGERLAARLDAVFLRQSYSRLVIDCNRDPALPEAIPEASDGTQIPGNRGLSPAARAARVAEIHAPYQQAIAAELARRAGAGLETVLVSLHSFTPVFQGEARPWHIGILHAGAEDGFARRLLAWLRAADCGCVGDNAPYVMDGTDHTVPRHAFAAGLLYAEIEVSQGELAAPGGVEKWCAILAEGLAAAL